MFGKIWPGYLPGKHLDPLLLNDSCLVLEALCGELRLAAGYIMEDLFWLRSFKLLLWLYFSFSPWFWWIIPNGVWWKRLRVGGRRRRQRGMTYQCNVANGSSLISIWVFASSSCIAGVRISYNSKSGTVDFNLVHVCKHVFYIPYQM